VADITITADRSQHVDFTLPYMSSGISMVVPMRDQRSKRAAWVFHKPLRWDLWLVSFAFFIFTGFVVWAVEHRSNEEFRGPPSYQIDTLLYFGFSTLVFAHSNARSPCCLAPWLLAVIRHCPLVATCLDQECPPGGCRGEPEEQPVAVRGGGVGIRGVHPAV